MMRLKTLFPRPLAAALLLYALLAGWKSLHIPVFEAPDEYYHMAVIDHVLRTGAMPPRTLPPPITDYQFPAQPWRQMAFHAPLYYHAMAALLRLMGADTSDFAAYRLNPHAQIGVALARDNQNIIAHRGGPSLLGVPLADALGGMGGAVRGLRFVSLALSVLALAGIYVFARAAVPQRPSAALAAVLFTALMPQFQFMGVVVSNDVLLTTLCAWGLALAALWWRSPRWRAWWVVSAGLLGGAAALTKASGAALAGLLGVLLIALAWRGRWRWTLALAAVLGYGALVLAIAGRWYMGNWMELGDLSAASVVARATGLRGSTPVTLDEMRGLFYSFWGLFGWFNVAMPPLFYGLAALISGAALVGLRAWRWERGPTVGLAAYVLLIVGAWWQFNQLTFAAQGRLFYPLLPLIALGLAVGLMRWPAAVRLLALGGLAAYCLLAPLVLWQAYQPDLRAATPPRDAVRFSLREPWSAQACVEVSLLDRVEVVAGAASFTVWWRAVCPLGGYWSVFVHAVDRTRQTCIAGDTRHILAQVDTMPQGGRLPVPRLPIGRHITDRYHIQVPPSTTHLHLGLYDAAGTFMRAFTAPLSSTKTTTVGQCAPELIELSLR